MMKRWMVVVATAMVLSALMLAGCGGGGGGGGSTTGGGTTTYSVSGAVNVGGVGLAGVTVSNGSKSATTDVSGIYTLTGLASGSHTLTPTKTGYNFTPASQSMTVNGANVSGQNFSAVTSYDIYGRITTEGSSLAGVTVSTIGGSAITDYSGNYTIRGLSNGSYTLTPAKTSYIFTPATLAVTVSNFSAWNKNFTAVFSVGDVTGVIQLPKTGQTASYAAGDDGALQKGVVWSNPRFIDNGNGAVNDNLTGLIWLKNANCFGPQAWSAALNFANSLASGSCGLSDGSTVGQWRLPNRKELTSLVDRSKSFPALPAGHPFTGAQFKEYWSSSTGGASGSSMSAWSVDMGYGVVAGHGKALNDIYVWPVRAGQ